MGIIADPPMAQHKQSFLLLFVYKKKPSPSLTLLLKHAAAR
jgi:hypothetical protein